jgi:hypothetical protein
MKWLVTGVALASLIATPALASRQHLNRDDYWNVTPVVQIFPPSDTWNDVQPRLYVGSTMRQLAIEAIAWIQHNNRCQCAQITSRIKPWEQIRTASRPFWPRRSRINTDRDVNSQALGRFGSNDRCNERLP